MPRRKRNARQVRRLRRLKTGHAKVMIGRQPRHRDDHRPGVVVAIGEWVWTK